MSEQDNDRRWKDSDRGVYEVWYMTWNDSSTGDGFWLRYITEAPQTGLSIEHQQPRGELWFTRFSPRDPKRTFGIRRHVALTQVASSESPFSVSIAQSRLTHGSATGQLAGNGHDVRWDLRWEPATQTMRLLPDVMYARGGLGETTVHSPNPRVPMSGTLVVDGETYAFEGASFGQSHVWGKKHAYTWTWGRCADFAGTDALLEVMGTRLMRRGILTPRLSLAVLHLDGETYRLNQYRHILRNRCSWTTGRYEFTAWSKAVKLEGQLTCAPSQMINAEYLDPDGTQVWCANTEIGDARVTVYRRSSGLAWREDRVLTSDGRAHFEHGGRTRDPSVTHLHELVR